MPSQVLVENGTLKSPGYGPTPFFSEIAYCPSMNCTPTVEFQPDLYDLQMEFTEIDLRTFYETNETDFVALKDSYGHQLVYAPPNYAGLNIFWATVSPVTVQFVTRWIQQLPLDKNGRGFSMNLNLIKSEWFSRYFYEFPAIFRELCQKAG